MKSPWNSTESWATVMWRIFRPADSSSAGGWASRGLTKSFFLSIRPVPSPGAFRKLGRTHKRILIFYVFCPFPNCIKYGMLCTGISALLWAYFPLFASVNGIFFHIMDISNVPKHFIIRSCDHELSQKTRNCHACGRWPGQPPVCPDPEDR